MFAVIVGGGKVGSHLAGTLAEQGHEVAIVEIDPDRCEALQELASNGIRVICGDGDEPYVLDDANTRSADAVVAATGHDEDNLVVCLIGKLEYDVPLTVARINNPSNGWLFTERFGVDVPVSNTAIMADVLKSLSLGDITTMLQLQAEGMVVDEITLAQDSAAVGKTIAELRLPANSQVMAIISNGQVVVPRGDTVFHGGDELLILAHREDERALRDAFASRTTGLI
jgi:trk system potassium uptake protein TrkA